LRGLRLIDAKDEDGDGQDRGDHREPQHGADVVVEQIHQADRQGRPERGADRVERLAKPERRAPHAGGREVRDQRIAGRAADSLADAIEETRHEHEPDRVREREQRLRRRREAIAEHGECLAPPERIGEPAGKHARDLCRRLGDPFDHTERGRARAERDDEKNREQSVDQLRGGIHEQRGQAERPHRSRQVLSARFSRSHGPFLRPGDRSIACDIEGDLSLY
jgi:hypothetical protein